jgi:predicted AAA+ superfamily ATPase
VASHLLKACHYWTDTGEGTLELFYLRNKEKVEVDFLVTLDKKPLFTVEVKSGSRPLNTAFTKFQEALDCPHIEVSQDLARTIIHREFSNSVAQVPLSLFLERLP